MYTFLLLILLLFSVVNHIIVNLYLSTFMGGGGNIFNLEITSVI